MSIAWSKRAPCHTTTLSLERALQALSVTLRQQTLDSASRNIGRLNSAIEHSKATDAQRLRDEYQRLVSRAWSCAGIGAARQHLALTWPHVRRQLQRRVQPGALQALPNP